MAKWEYLVVHLEGSKVAEDNPEFDNYLDVDKYTEALNRYGNAGWELVSFESIGHGARAAFKREKVIQEAPPQSQWAASQAEPEPENESEPEI